MNSKLYCVGVGPGDPELLTLKGQRILTGADVIAFPGGSSLAYRIASQAVPAICEKTHLILDLPMSADSDVLQAAHRAAVSEIEAVLLHGQTVAFLTLGDPAFYSGFSYLLDRFRRDGFDVEPVSGVTSFSAASAELLLPLALGSEQVRILTSPEDYDPAFPGTLIILKAGKNLKEWKLRLRGRRVWLVENCGLPEETICSDNLPDTAKYFSLLIVK